MPGTENRVLGTLARMTDTQIDAPRPLPEPLDDSQTGTPARRPGSARRTSSIDMVWPDGYGTPLHLVGRARDLVTTPTGGAVVVDTAEIDVTISNDRRIDAIEVVPERPGVEDLVGTQGGTYLRTAIDHVLPGEREAGTPLHLLLDDVAGTSLIAGFAWTRHRPLELRAERPSELGVRKGRIICSGLRPGGTAQVAMRDARFDVHGIRSAGQLTDGRDPLAWHEFPARPTVCMRRHRRVDVIPDRDELVVDAFFRDSSLGARRPRDRAARVHGAGAPSTPTRLDAEPCRGDAARVAVPRVPVGAGARDTARRPSGALVPHRRADDAHRAPGVHAPERHAPLPGRGPRAGAAIDATR